MSDDYNVHGLSRDIPTDIKRHIRKECGFGCVCCGLAIATYEHIIPEFKDAKEHDPEKMAYLCGSCHDRVTRRIWSKDKVIEARENPWCIVNKKCHDSFDISSMSPTLWVGPNEVTNIHNIVKINEEVILSISAPKEAGQPYSISGVFYDDNGNFWCGVELAN